MKELDTIIILGLMQFTALSINYPIRMTYVNSIKSWDSQNNILASLGVPGYADANNYNYIAFAFWSLGQTFDAVKIWENPLKFIGTTNPSLGATKDQMQKILKKKYNDKGITLMVSAFGEADFPINKYNPTITAKSLSQWVLANNLDGVDINIKDDKAFEDGFAQNWIKTFHKSLRQLLPNHIITHSLKSLYFRPIYFRAGGYLKINKQIGNTVDFYVVSFFNCGRSLQYNTYEEIFKLANMWALQTSVEQLILNGIPSNKIVIGKPVNKQNRRKQKINGWVSSIQLSQWIVQAYKQIGWKTGIMLWEFQNDTDGKILNNIMGGLDKQIIQQQSNNKHESNTTNYLPQSNNQTNNLITNKKVQNLQQNIVTDEIKNFTSDYKQQQIGLKQKLKQKRIDKRL